MPTWMGGGGVEVIHSFYIHASMYKPACVYSQQIIVQIPVATRPPGGDHLGMLQMETVDQGDTSVVNEKLPY